MYNKVILIGRLTRDPEVRTTTTGLPVASFTLAVNRNYVSQSGVREADFINCVCFRKLAEIVSQYVRKGQLISVDGRLQTRSYDAQDGSKRYVTEVICDNVVFLESRSQYESPNINYFQQQPTFNINNDNNFTKEEEYFDDLSVDISEDDLPF